MATPYHRRHFGLVETLKMLIRQGADIRCARTGERFTIENVHLAQKEHELELGLLETAEAKRAQDTWQNCCVSMKAAHAIVTNGTKATTAGSSKHRISKAKRHQKERLDVKAAPPRESKFKDAFGNAIELTASGPVASFRNVVAYGRGKPKALMLDAKVIKSRGFDKTRTRGVDGKVRPRKPKRKR